MKRLFHILLVTPLLLVSCLNSNKIATDSAFIFTENPLVKDCWTADPAPLVVGDTLFLYVGHDEYYAGQDTAVGGREFNITEWLCYSTTDMERWTSHGAVLKPTDFAWAVGEAWASQVVKRGDKYYFYTTVQQGNPYCKAIGVAVGDSPTGPFTDAIGEPLVTDSMTDNGARGWWNDIDPTVLVDGEEAWLCWGNGSCFLARLSDDMTHIDGDIRVLDLPLYMEGPWLHKYNGLYYLTYAGQSEEGDCEDIRYATATSMTGEWTPRGELTGMAKNSFTIHPGITEFRGKWYLFHHNATLTLGDIPPAIGRRSVCVSPLYYNADGTMEWVDVSR